MRRTVVVGTTVLVVVVLATPALRRPVAARLDAVTSAFRERVAAFRTDYADREAQLRERLLPPEAEVADAARRRADVPR